VAAPIVRSLHPAVVKIFGGNAGVPSRHRPAGRRRPVIERRSAARSTLSPGGGCVFPDLGNTGRLQHTVGTVDEWLTAQLPGSRLAAVETT
jgi:hypothetical protein